MFTCFDQSVLQFFLDIRFNNNREYMHARADDYKRIVRQPFYDFIEALAPTMLQIDANMETRPQKCLSRIYRDTRFSPDKSPYRDHHWISFGEAARAKDGAPFYWLELRVDSLSYGVGLWGENRPAMDAMRMRMAAHPDEFELFDKLLEEHQFAVGGGVFKRMEVPPQIPRRLSAWYRAKGVYFEKQGLNVGMALREGIVEQVKTDFLVLAPLYHLLRGCVEEAVSRAEQQGTEA